MSTNDLTQELTLQIISEDLSFTKTDAKMHDLMNAMRDCNTKELYEKLMALNTEVLCQRTEIHKLLHQYKSYRLNVVTENTKLMIRNRITFFNEKSVHLTEIRNDMSVLQRMLHSNAVY